MTVTPQDINMLNYGAIGRRARACVCMCVCVCVVHACVCVCARACACPLSLSLSLSLSFVCLHRTPTAVNTAIIVCTAKFGGRTCVPFAQTLFSHGLHVYPLLVSPHDPTWYVSSAHSVLLHFWHVYPFVVVLHVPTR